MTKWNYSLIDFLIQMISPKSSQRKSQYRNEIILCLSRMSPEGWKAVGDKILEIAEEIKKNRIEEE